MTWEYRVIKEVDSIRNSKYTVREVYTFDDGTLSCTADACEVGGHTPEEIAEDFWKYSLAFTKPVIILMIDKLIETDEMIKIYDYK